MGCMTFFLINGYGLYITILFYHLAIKNKIVLFCLQPHLIQLLDIEIFQLFKDYHITRYNGQGYLVGW